VYSAATIKGGIKRSSGPHQKATQVLGGSLLKKKRYTPYVRGNDGGNQWRGSLSFHLGKKRTIRESSERPRELPWYL